MLITLHPIVMSAGGGEGGGKYSLQPSQGIHESEQRHVTSYIVNSMREECISHLSLLDFPGAARAQNSHYFTSIGLAAAVSNLINCS